MKKINEKLYYNISSKVERKYIDRIIDLENEASKEVRELYIEKTMILEEKVGYSLPFFEYIFVEHPDFLRILERKKITKFKELKPIFEKNSELFFDNKQNPRVPNVFFKDLSKELERKDIDSFVLELLDFYPELVRYNTTFQDLILTEVLFNSNNNFYFSILCNLKIQNIDKKILNLILEKDKDLYLLLLKSSYRNACEDINSLNSFYFDSPDLKPFYQTYIPMYIAADGEISKVLDIMNGFNLDFIDDNSENPYNLKYFLLKLEEFMGTYDNMVLLISRLSIDSIDSCLNINTGSFEISMGLKKASYPTLKLFELKRDIGFFIKSKTNFNRLFKELDNYYLQMSARHPNLGHYYLQNLMEKYSKFHVIANNKLKPAYEDTLIGDYFSTTQIKDVKTNKYLLEQKVYSLSILLKSKNIHIIDNEEDFLIKDLFQRLSKERVFDLLVYGIFGAKVKREDEFIKIALNSILNIKNNEAYSLKEINKLTTIVNKLSTLKYINNFTSKASIHEDILVPYFLKNLNDLSDSSIKSFDYRLEEIDHFKNERKKTIRKIKEVLEL